MKKDNLSVPGSQASSLPSWALPAAMAVLTISLFGDALFVSGRVPCDEVSDLRAQYLNWRQFAVTEIRGGRFPLWNPYAFSGTPFFGDPQSAMLYPPNWIYLLLAPDRATSVLVAVHFFLAGWLAGLFCRAFGASVAAAILGGILYACAGPIITNLRPGHLPLLFSAAWAPLLMLCVERAMASKVTRIPWVLGGVGGVAMLALDGYPQFAYYTALAAGVYTLVRLTKAERKWQALAAVGAMFAGGWAIAAVQILASASVAGESIRAGGLSFADAGAYSLPPENLLTMIVPGFFGDAAHMQYFGRWYWWEACVYIGPAALCLALIGIRRGRGHLAILAGILFILALGPATPMFRLLYNCLPGFSSFRATNRFGLLGILMFCPLAACGWDGYREGTIRTSRWAIILIVATLILGVAAAWANSSERNGPGDFAQLMDWLVRTRQVLDVPPQREAGLAGAAAHFAAGQLIIAAALTLITSMLLFSQFRKKMPMVLFALAAGPLIWFAAGQRTSSDRSPELPEGWKEQIAALPAGERVLINNSVISESGARNGFENIDGDNPLVINRMAKFLAAVQGISPGNIGVNYPVRSVSRLYGMLRGGLILAPYNGVPVTPLPTPLGRLALIDNFQRAGGPEAALRAVMAADFDPARTVVLESEPHPIPTPGSENGTARVVSETTDELEIEADVPASRILLITDAYSAGWRAEPMSGAIQPYYEVLPADYCLRAVPLTAGHHHFRLVYRPVGFFAGKWISGMTIAIYMIAIIARYLWKLGPRAPQAGPLNN